jgi:hypothetical protein
VAGDAANTAAPAAGVWSQVRGELHPRPLLCMTAMQLSLSCLPEGSGPLGSPPASQ